MDSITNKNRSAQILLVDDNYGDVVLTQRAFKGSKVITLLNVARSAEEALAILCKEEKFADAITPDLILLDLNLPKMNGEKLLMIIKETEGLKQIPVIIFSGSCSEQDVIRCYNLHANGYVAKPMNLDKYKEIVEKIENFWFSLALLPDSKEKKLDELRV